LIKILWIKLSRIKLAWFDIMKKPRTVRRLQLKQFKEVEKNDRTRKIPSHDNKVSRDQVR
jgi:hypothetical protein